VSLPLPKTNVRSKDAPPTKGTPQGGRRLFIAAESLRGDLKPKVIRNQRDIGRATLIRSGVGILGYDCVDIALREGVPEVVHARIVGPAAAPAVLNLDGTVGGAPYAVILTVNEVGEWANGAAGGLKGEVTSPGGGTNRQVVIYQGAAAPENIILKSPVFTTRADVMAWNIVQNLITVTLGADNTLPPVAAAANFAGGSSDSGGITGAEVTAALNRCKADMGNGQVVVPGRNTVASNTLLAQHCQDFDRTALGEVAAGLVVSDVVTEAATLRAIGSGAEALPRLLGMWAQFATAPGITPGTTRTVPWSIVAAGLMARLEQAEGHPNVSPIGDYGVPQYVTGVDRYFSDDDAETLYGAGVNVVEELFDAPRNATFHTLDNPDTSDWSDLAHTRLDRALHADATELGRGMGGRVINRKTINELAGKMRTRLESRYYKRGAIFGNTFEQAARVDTDSVNDTDTMAAREANMDLGVVMSEHAEQVNVNISKVPIGQEV
jgi:hypothetical protein